MNLCEWTIQWGSAAEWAAAFGTVASLWFLAIGLRDERRQRRVDEEKAAEERRDAEKRDARRVSASVHTAQGIMLDIAIHNGGDGPILDVEPGLYQDGVKLNGQVVNWHEMMQIPAGTSLVANLDMEQAVPDSGAAVGLTFTDAAGVRWHRLHTNQPVRLIDT